MPSSRGLRSQSHNHKLPPAHRAPPLPPLALAHLRRQRARAVPTALADNVRAAHRRRRNPRQLKLLTLTPFPPFGPFPLPRSARRQSAAPTAEGAAAPSATSAVVKKCPLLMTSWMHRGTEEGERHRHR